MPLTDVRGGSHGLAVAYEQARALASAYDGAGNRMRDWAGAGGRVLRDGDLLESALLSPRSFAEAELTVLDATTGPDGVLVESVGWETDAAADPARGDAPSRRPTRWSRRPSRSSTTRSGAPSGFALGGRAAGAWCRAWSGLSRTPRSESLTPLQAAARAAAATEPSGCEAWVAEHPWLLEHLANGGGGLVDGFWSGITGQPVVGPDGGLLFHPTTEDAAPLLAGLYPDDGAPQVVSPRRPAPHGPGDRACPSSLAELLAHLRRGQPALRRPGLPRQRHHRGADGRRARRAAARGLPARHRRHADHAVRAATTTSGTCRPTSPRSGGASTTYAEGILAAMAEAGIGPGEPVALVGHSQGGIMAAWLAAHQDTYPISAVVTAGSPVAGLGPFPEGPTSLSLENRGDVIPLTEGEANPDAAQPRHGHLRRPVAPSLAGQPRPGPLRHRRRRRRRRHAPSLVAELARLRALGFLAGDEDADERGSSR